MKKVYELGGAILRLVSRFAAERRGTVLIYVSIMLPLLIGGALLAVDASKFFNLQTQLQKGVDSLALAAAAELDMKPTAIIRADAAIANLVQNQHRFSDAGATQITAADVTVRYLSGLPANDALVIDGSYKTEDPAQARYVEVKVTDQNMTSVFPASFLGGSDTVTAGARAVAGFQAAVCQFTPMFMCNPFEGTGTSIFTAIANPAIRRRQIQLRKKGGGESQYAAGNYGFLQPPGGEMGANVLREMLALVHPPACFIQPGVELRPGFIASADQGLNVRFDMYDGALNGRKNNPDFRPAKNVRKGYAYDGNACQAGLDDDDPPQQQGLPDDTCFATDSCPHMDGRMGDGDWDIEGYKLANNLLLPGVPNSASRYEVYLNELATGEVSTASPGGETGSPQCYSGGVLNDDPDRRLLFIAVLDCQAHNVSEENMGNSGPPVPVTAFMKMFLTKPVDQGPDQNIYAELVEVIEPGNTTSNVVRDIVQLYR